MHISLTRERMRYGAALALLGGTLLSTQAASAATIAAADCQAQSGTYAVRAVAINHGDTITLFQTGSDGHFEGQGSVEVYCRKGSTNFGEIQDAQVRVTVTPESGVTSPFTVQALNGVPTSGVNPVIVGPFTGTVDFLISAPNSLLAPGQVSANVATQIELVTAAWGAPLIDPKTDRTIAPHRSGDINAQTPELDSLPLFATGALGLLSYVGLRRRARGK